jgi:hypothetical protein
MRIKGASLLNAGGRQLPTTSRFGCILTQKAKIAPTPAPQKEFFTITYSAAAVEPASTHAAPDVTACSPAGEGLTASATPSPHPAATGPDGASPGARTAHTSLAAHHAVPVLSLRCGNTLTPAPVNWI